MEAGAGRLDQVQCLCGTSPIRSTPSTSLRLPWTVHSFAFQPAEDSSVIAGGLADGRIVIWDTSEIRDEILLPARPAQRGARATTAASVHPVCRPKQLSEAAMSHVLPVTDIKWLGPVAVNRKGEVTKTEAWNFFATTSADGRVLFWPTEHQNPKTKVMEWTPSHECKMTRGGPGHPTGRLTRLHLTSPGVSPRFGQPGMAGARVAQCDFKMQEGDETVPMDASRTVSHFHEGPVRSIERSPFFPDVALSVGNWTFKLFKEGSQKPIFSAPVGRIPLRRRVLSEQARRRVHRQEQRRDRRVGLHLQIR